MDRHTLFTTQAALLIFLGIGVLLARRAFRWQTEDNSAHWFSAGYVLGGIGLLLLAYRGSISPLLSIVLGNLLFMLIMPCMNRALAVITRQNIRPTFYLMLAIALCTVASYAYFAFVKPDQFMRSMEACVVMTVLMGMNLVVVLRSTDQVIAPAMRVLALLIALHIVFTGLRFVMLLQNRDEWFSLGGLITAVGVAITFMWVDALRLRDELEQSAMLDPLTSLFNRRALDLVAARELNRAARRNQPCSALMIDIDRFKDINDGMGHAAGDATLCAVAEALRSSLRGSDMATRLGGDEFFVLLPDANEEVADLVVARIRVSVDQLRMRTISGQVFTVSVSIGRVTEHSPNATVGDLLHSSDVMLYREKQLRGPRIRIKPPGRYTGTGGAQVQPSRA